MAGSSYYYNLYKQYQKSAEALGRNIKELERIRNALHNDFYDEQRNVNTQLSELKDELGKSVRHDASFDRTREACEVNKEKATNADEFLYKAVTELDQEIAELNRRRSDDEAKRDENYNRYKEKKEEERQEWLDKINIFN